MKIEKFFGKSKFGKILHEVLNFFHKLGNLKKGQMHHCLRADAPPVHLSQHHFHMDDKKLEKCDVLSFIRSGHFYSAPSSPLLHRGAPYYSTDTVSEFHAEAHRQLQVKDLPKGPTWRLERESNPRPSG